MKVLVTGACGFVGSHLVEALAEAGHEVTAADLPAALEAPREDRARWPEVCRAVGARLVPLDVTDPPGIAAALDRPEVVFHAAAVYDYLAPEGLLARVNVEGTRNLLEALVAAGSCRRVVNLGAAEIYGEAPKGVAFAEDAPARPPNAYVRSKWEQELAAHSFRSRGIEVVTIRMSSPYGPRAAYGGAQVLLDLAVRPTVFANQRANIPFVHVRDVCRAALFLADKHEVDGEAFNVTDDGRINSIGLARLVADELGTAASIFPAVPAPVMRGVLSGAARLSGRRARRRGTRPLLEHDQVQYFGRSYVYDNQKLKSLGFWYQWPEPEPGLRETIRWYLDRGWIEAPARGGRRATAADR